jgi:predicted TIM-barrel fold metal-dependent hydrolase
MLQYYQLSALPTHDANKCKQEWSEEGHLDLMRENSITKSIVSISSPGVHLVPGDDAASRTLARRCNEFASELSQRRPEQFAFWASLPLPNVPDSLAEITYAFDTLHAYGVAIETNHGGIYLGDAVFDSVFDELNRRAATVFIHPTTPCMNHSPLQDGDSHHHTAVSFLPQFPSPLMEFLFDTARAVLNLFASGTIQRCPNITFVIPHAGGTLPLLIQRFSAFATTLLRSDFDLSRDVIKETFKRQFYFDLAGFVFPDQIHAILRLVGPERLLYGSDYPFTPAPAVAKLIGAMSGGLLDIYPDESVRRAIYSRNAERLLHG